MPTPSHMALMTKFDCKFWATHLFVQQFFTLTTRKDINIPHHWPFVRSVITIITANFFSRETMLFLAATKQLYEWFIPSVCLSHLFHYVSIIVSPWNFQKLLPWPKVMSMRKVKVTEVKRNFDPNWVFPDSKSSLNSLMAMKWCTKLEVA